MEGYVMNNNFYLESYGLSNDDLIKYNTSINTGWNLSDPKQCIKYVITNCDKAISANECQICSFGFFLNG